jgi:hypothetical protein
MSETADNGSGWCPLECPPGVRRLCEEEDIRDMCPIAAEHGLVFTRENAEGDENA